MPTPKRSKKPGESPPHPDRVVPSAWVSKLRADWPRAVEFDVEFRTNPHASWRIVDGATAPKAELVDRDDEQTVQLGVEQARDYAQRLYDAAWAHADGLDKRCDYRLRSFGPDKSGAGRVEVGEPEGRGGRCDPRREHGTSEDVPDVDDDEPVETQLDVVAQILREVRAERKEWVAHLLKMAGGYSELVEQVGAHFHEAHRLKGEVAANVRQLEVDRLDAEVRAYRSEQAGKFGADFLEKAAPGFTMWAQARYQESLGRRHHAPKGDAVLDALAEVCDSLDVVAANRVGDLVGPDVYTSLHLLLTGVDSWTRAEVVEQWTALGPKLVEHWRRILDAVSPACRIALSQLGDAVEQAGQGAA